MGKTSAAQLAAIRRWKEKAYDRLNLQIKKGERERFRGYANRLGMSLNAFAVRAIEKEIERIENGEIKAK